MSGVHPNVDNKILLYTVNKHILKDGRKNVLRSRENILKSKCRKSQRKFIKYKIRKDGKEDIEVLDVSHTLQTSLKIKSPNNSINNSSIKVENPQNYLFKMVRKKQKAVMTLNKADNILSCSANVSSVVDSISSLQTGCIDETQVPVSQDRKQTNAFKLLMDSRNKSIGSNSPGKEKNVEECENDDILEKRSLKTKRVLALQKLAESKGSLKKKEIEEYHEKNLKKKMEKRAEKLKEMLVNSKSQQKNINKQYRSLKKNKESNCKPMSNIDKYNTSELSNTTEANNTTNDDVLRNVKEPECLQLVDMFEEPLNSFKIKSKSSRDQMSKEDENFLSKLSPSIRKKENMLSYFKKIDKDYENQANVTEEEMDNGDNIIKVKLTSKNKLRKRSLCLKKRILSDNPNLESNGKLLKMNENVPTSIALNNADQETNKKTSLKQKKGTDSNSANEITCTSDFLEQPRSRAKRSVKRPISYRDYELFSSDEEYNNYSPRRKKHVKHVWQEKERDATAIHEETLVIKSSLRKIESNKINEEITITEQNSRGKVESAERKENKKIQTMKLAPIFNSKHQYDTTINEAKQKFLQSGIPDKLKKIISQQSSKIQSSSDFPSVVHVQQKNTISVIQSRVCIPLNDILSENDETCSVNSSFQNLLSLNQPVSPSLNFKTIETAFASYNKHNLLKNMKESYPKFPVYRTYRSLRARSKGEFIDINHQNLDNSVEIINSLTDWNNVNPDILKWTDKYKALSTNQIIGNFEKIKELKKWLVLWSESQVTNKNGKSGNESSDYYQSDSDSRDSVRPTNNLLLLTGPIGSGKTSSVYAVATELAIKVIEVNASSKRTGKIMLQDLQEATQSHKVNRSKSSSSVENSQKSQGIVNFNLKRKPRKRGKPKVSEDAISKRGICTVDENEGLSQSVASQENVRTGMSLILIDDADIVFDQDDGFVTAISQLIHCSKRPVILVASSLTCPHLQKFLQLGKVITMNSLQPKMLGTWLDLMCLADDSLCCLGLGAKVLDFYKGDIRKAINSLQFYMFNKTHIGKLDFQNSDDYKLNIEEENMSLVDYKASEESDLISSTAGSFTNTVWNFIENQLFEFTSMQFVIWWSLPNILYNQFNCASNTVDNKTDDKASKKNVAELKLVANVIDSISLSDYLSQINPSANFTITSDPWYSDEKDSVSERENFQCFDYTHCTSSEISYYLTTKSIILASTQSQIEDGLSVPSLRDQRGKDKIVSRHHNLTDNLNPGTTLDRRSLALDYWPACREICRIEKTKTGKNCKRNNRFCHYLKSLNVMNNNETFDKLCESLSNNNNSVV